MTAKASKTYSMHVLFSVLVMASQALAQQNLTTGGVPPLPKTNGIQAQVAPIVTRQVGASGVRPLVSQPTFVHPVAAPANSSTEFQQPVPVIAQPVSFTQCAEPNCGAATECTSGGCAAAPCAPTCGADGGCASCASPPACGCAACCKAKPKKPAAKPNPCATSHKGVFYANDFSYLKDPKYKGCCLGDDWKLMPIGECGSLDIGGQFRLRYHHEQGMGQNAGFTRFQDNSNDFLLTRMRLYSNWKINSWARFYTEGIYAGVGGDDDYLPRGIDENYVDLTNIFVDLKLTESTSVRVGRQELVYGAQRTVSPLDWANTRRTFEGVKVMYKQDDLAVDGFYTNVVPVVGNRFDEANYDLSFYGMYSTYKGIKDTTLDFYYLGFDNQTSDFSIHTIGARLNGSMGEWLYEFEGAPQFGSQGGLGLDHAAGFATAGIGRKIKQMPWSTTLWAYYDYASGNNVGGEFNRYNQLFPLAHKYLGFIDATQRSNIESPNILLTMKPTKKLSLLFWYYHFIANQDSDIVPSIGGTPAQDANSTDWGDELDIVASYSISPRSKILFGWSHFWAGDKIVAANREDADFFYTEFTLNF